MTLTQSPATATHAAEHLAELDHLERQIHHLDAEILAAAAQPTDPADPADQRLDARMRQRAALRHRHLHQLNRLMGQREDLRGVHALADLVDDALRWSA